MTWLSLTTRGAGIVHDPVCVVKEVSISREVTDFSQPCRPGGRGRTRAPSATATCLATRHIHLGRAAGGQQEPETRFTSGTTCRVWRGSAGRASPPEGRVFGAGQVKCDGPTPMGVVLCDDILKERSFAVTPIRQRQCNSSEQGRFNATTASDKVNATPASRRGLHLLCLLTA